MLAAAFFLTACSVLPAAREREHAFNAIDGVADVAEIHVACERMVLAGDQLCVDVVMKDGAALRFERVGFDAFGANARHIVVGAAGGLMPRIASCHGVSAPNFHRDGVLGHHFTPTLIDVREAIERHREVLEEVQFWPQCPQFWEVQDKRGVNYRYCARRPANTAEPPPPDGCPTP